MIKSFSDIKVWQKAHSLVLGVYKLSDKFPRKEDFCLTSQLRRAVISIPSNIAEGFSRKSKKESIQFYYISTGSLEEVKYQLLLSRDLGYISEAEYSNICLVCDEVGKLLNAWIRAQNSFLNA